MNSTDKKPYIFISYAHADNSKVLPAITALQRSGVNLWYDNGIVAGSEWPEFIAEKVIGCASFVLFISKAYLDSQNCKRELNFAISRKKDILSIFLEDVDLTPGMEMQLGSYQAIFRKRFPSDSAFLSSISVEPFFESCRVNAGENSDTPEVKKAVTPQNNSANGTYGIPSSQKTAAEKERPSAFKPNFNEKTDNTAAPTKEKNKVTAGLLSLFLGGFGIQFFYLGNYIYGILSIVFVWTYVPSIIGMVLGVRMLTMNKEKFEAKAAKKSHPWQYFY